MPGQNPTIRNHVIPCFWSALWNQSYFEYFLAGGEKKEGKKNAPREQKVFSLEFKTQKVLQKKVGNLFYVQNLGISEVSESELHKLKNIYSSDFHATIDGEHFNQNNVIKTHLVDIENLFSLTEKYYGYKEMLEVVKTNSIPSIKEKVEVACFMSINLVRGIRFFDKLMAKYEASENPKLDALRHFRAILSDPDAMYNIILPKVSSKWTLYSLDEYLFPLCDCPIIYHGKYIWVIISPKHLIEIDTSVRNLEQVKYKKSINMQKYITIKTLIVENALSTIIFPTENFLAKLRKTYTWKKKQRELSGLIFSHF